MKDEKKITTEAGINQTVIPIPQQKTLIAGTCDLLDNIANEWLTEHIKSGGNPPMPGKAGYDGKNYFVVYYFIKKFPA